MNNQSNCLIRQAEIDDARDLAKLIDIAGEGIPTWLWSKSADETSSPLDIGIERAERAEGGFSFTNALVAVTHGAIGGMVLSYAITEAPDDNPDDLPDPIAPFVALEKHSSNTWYINALAVFAAVRDQGIGTQLLEAAENQARSNGLNKMSIQVYEQNAGAVRLYQRLGYRIAEQESVRRHPCQPYYTGNVLLLKKLLSD